MYQSVLNYTVTNIVNNSKKSPYYVVLVHCMTGLIGQKVAKRGYCPNKFRWTGSLYVNKKVVKYI